MRRTPIMLELTPTRLTGARVVGGRLRDLRSAALDQSRWTHSWEHGLRALDAPLVGLLEALGATRPSVTLLYSSPQIAMDVVGAPGRASSAREAARLAVAEGASFDLLTNPAGVADLGCDASGDPALAHAIGVADREESPALLIDWIERNGGAARRLFPVEAAAIAHVARRALANTTSVPEAWVRIGEHATSLAVGVEGRLLQVRTIEVGLVTITEPLSRMFAGAESAESPRRAALRFLFTRGVPEARETIDEARGLHGADVLPSIQPVLQRLFVEIKQSLRFGLSREDHQAVGLKIVGPGAHVPRLADMLAEHTERFVVAEPGLLATPAPDAPEDACSVFADAPPPWPDLNLLPQSRLEDAAVGATRRALIGGAIAAALLIGAESALHFGAAKAAETQLRSMKASLQQAGRLETTLERLNKFDRALASTEARIDERLGRLTPWSAWLLDAARRTPPGVRITHVQADVRTGSPTAMIRGHAEEASADGAPASERIAAFARALEASALVERVALGATQRMRTPSGDARQFEVTVTLVGVPASAMTEATR